MASQSHFKSGMGSETFRYTFNETLTNLPDEERAQGYPHEGCAGTATANDGTHLPVLGRGNEKIKRKRWRNVKAVCMKQ